MSYKIPEKDKLKLLENIRIEDVIGKSVSLRKAGVNRIGLCPFHADRTPSMYVSPNKNIYKCYACGAGGDVINFVMREDSLSFPEACHQLAKEYNIEITKVELTPEEQEKEKLRESMGIVLSVAQSQFETNLKEYPESIQYLKETRGLTDDMIKLYGAGYSRNDNQIVREFTAKGYKFEVLEAASLAQVYTDDEKGTSYKSDFFKNRITFPFYSNSGKLLGFTGRHLAPTKEIAKFKNSRDTELFHKGSNLFGLHQAKKEISRTGKAYFVEGQFDVISFAQYGLQNTVCGSGTALTDHQAMLLHRFAESVTLVYDKDTAGAAAALRSIKIFLSYGFEVKGCILPEGEDPDSFARKTPKDKKLSQAIQLLEKDFLEYAYELCKKETDSSFDEVKILDMILDCVSVIPDNFIRVSYQNKVATLFKMQPSDVDQRVKPKKELKIEQWKDGFYGIEEATEILAKEETNRICTLTFDQDKFIELFEQERPVIFSSGIPSMSDIQLLRSNINQLLVEADTSIAPYEKDEPKGLMALKALFKEGIDISVSYEEGKGAKKETKYRIFCDYYVSGYGSIIEKDETGIIKELATERCLDVIADSNNTSRTTHLAKYAGYIGIAKGALEKLLKPRLSKKKNKLDFESQQIEAEDNMQVLDALYPPAYVDEDPLIKSNYKKYKFFPWLDKDNVARAYVAQNENNSGNNVISDFIIEPLLHVTDDNGGNKRVVKFTHIYRQYDKYVELQSNMLASLQTLKVRLIEEGPYNFLGSSYQYDRIRQQLSYNFIPCTEMKILGQQPEGFFAFSNAILHSENNGEYKLQRIDPQGVVTHNKVNFYLPAFSNIHIKQREGNDAYKQARNIMYKDIPEADQLSFEAWTSLMNNVYNVNDNGKWAILFTLTAAFRDFIYKKTGHFTAPFFIGPRGSGKTQIAESMRNFFMADTTPSFNLNTGTDAAFFLLLETLRNVIVVMEEYNDKMISDAKFQGLKSATLDGEGRIKIKDMGSKTMDSSDINASLTLLGQEAPQQDDGSLGTRVILRNVPHRENDFTEEERAQFDKLKNHERIGLCNILIEVLKQRKVVEKYYMPLLNEEIKKLKDAIKVDVVNGEGLARIVNAVALMVTTCKLFEDHIPSLKLPFTYGKFFEIGKEQILSQLDQLSSSNKLTNFFKSLSAMISSREILINKELKITELKQVTVKLSGKNTETKNFEEPTKVLFMDLTEVYNKYRRSVGDKEALTQSSLISYFESCKAFIGLCRSTQFKWQEQRYSATGGVVPGGEDGLDPQVNNRAQLNMETNTKNTSAYMFNYYILKELMDIDFERTEGEDLPF